MFLLEDVDSVKLQQAKGYWVKVFTEGENQIARLLDVDVANGRLKIQLVTGINSGKKAKVRWGTTFPKVEVYESEAEALAAFTEGN